MRVLELPAFYTLNSFKCVFCLSRVSAHTHGTHTYINTGNMDKKYAEIMCRHCFSKNLWYLKLLQKDVFMAGVWQPGYARIRRLIPTWCQQDYYLLSATERCPLYCRLDVIHTAEEASFTLYNLWKEQSDIGVFFFKAGVSCVSLRKG